MKIDVVGIDVNPTIWAVFCEECNSYFGKRSDDPANAMKCGQLARGLPPSLNWQTSEDLQDSRKRMVLAK